MNRSFRYRLKPNRQQVRTLKRILETHRQLYNAALQERREAWRMRRISVSYTMQASQIKEIRSFDAVFWFPRHFPNASIAVLPVGLQPLGM